MKFLGWFLASIILILSAGCDKHTATALSSIPEKKSDFKKTVFTEPQSGNTVTLISETECEISESGQILLAEYSRQDSKLRVVIRTLGTATVQYMDIVPVGLITNGQTYLLPEPLQKARAQMEAAREAQRARQQAAKNEEERQRQMKVQEEQDRRNAVLSKRDGLINVFGQMFQKGATVVGTAGPESPRDTKKAYRLSIVSPLHSKLHPNDFGADFEVFGHFNWVGRGGHIGNDQVDKDCSVKLIGTITLNPSGGFDTQLAISTDRDHPGEFYWTTLSTMQWDGREFNPIDSGGFSLRAGK